MKQATLLTLLLLASMSEDEGCAKVPAAVCDTSESEGVELEYPIFFLHCALLGVQNKLSSLKRKFKIAYGFDCMTSTVRLFKSG